MSEVYDNRKASKTSWQEYRVIIICRVSWPDSCDDDSVCKSSDFILAERIEIADQVFLATDGHTATLMTSGPSVTFAKRDNA